MRQWPKWLRITFIVSGSLFVIAVLFSVYVLASHAVIPPLSAYHPSQPSNPGEPSIEPTSLVNIITAVTGLVTALTGLYGQILAGRKQEIDYELAKQQIRGAAPEAPKKANRRKKR